MRIIENRGPFPQTLVNPQDYERLQHSLDAMNIEVASLREELLTLKEERWDGNLISSGLIGGMIFVALSLFTGLWILSIIGVGMCAIAVIHQFGARNPDERNKRRVSERN